MAGITLEIALARLQQYLDAEAAALSGQSYSIETAGGKRQLTRADLKEIRDGIDIWNGRVANLTSAANGRSRSRTMIVKG